MLTRSYLLSPSLCLLILLLIGLDRASVHAQTPEHSALLTRSFSTQELQKDLEAYQEILAQAHPNLYRFVSRRQLNQYYQEIFFALKHAATLEDFYGLLLPLTQSLNCRATRIGLPSSQRESTETSERIFPFPLKVIQGKLYVDAIGLDVPLGTEILSINAHPSDEIMQQLAARSTYRPRNTQVLTPLIERKFSSLFLSAFPHADSFLIFYRTPQHKQILQKRIVGISSSQLKERQENRYSASPAPEVMIIDSLKTAIFPIQAMEEISREKRIIRTRRFIHKLRKKQITHLVLDLRSPKTLPSEYYHTLLSHLSYNGIDPYDSVWVKGLRVPMSQYIRPQDQKMIPRIERWLFRNFEAKGRNLYLLKAAKTPHIVPNRERFRGTLYILIDQHSSQSNTFLAALLRDQADATFIGEETLAESYAHIGGITLNYRLPHTQIELSIPMVYYKYHIRNRLFPEGSGITPHYEQQLDVQSFLRQQDPVLDFSLKLVKLGQVR